MSFLKIDNDNTMLYSDLFREMNNETERGIVLISSEFLSHCLKILLKSFLIKSKKTEELFEDFKPLGSFYSRINISFSCGLISSEEYKELDIIRDIRNRCAHSFKDYSLDDENRVQNLSKYQFYKNHKDHSFSERKNALINTVIQLSDSILKRSNKIKPISLFQKKERLEYKSEKVFMKKISNEVKSTPGLRTTPCQSSMQHEGHRYKGYYVNSWEKWLFFGWAEEFQNSYWNESFIFDTPYWIEMSEDAVGSCYELVHNYVPKKIHPRYKNRVVIPFQGIDQPKNVGNTIRILSVLSGSDYRDKV